MFYIMSIVQTYVQFLLRIYFSLQTRRRCILYNCILEYAILRLFDENNNDTTILLINWNFLEVQIYKVENEI